MRIGAEFKARIKKLRSLLNTNVALQYLGSHRSIQFGLGISEAEAIDIYNNYWKTYQGERNFFINKVKEMSEDGYITFFGEGCILTPDIDNEPENNEVLKKVRTAYNACFQSGAFITLSAMDRVQRKLFGKDGFIPFLSVYDSIIYSCKDEDAIKVRRLFIEEMTRPYSDDQVVMLKADCEIGHSYKAERDFEGADEELQEILTEMRV